MHIIRDGRNYVLSLRGELLRLVVRAKNDFNP